MKKNKAGAKKDLQEGPGLPERVQNAQLIAEAARVMIRTSDTKKLCTWFNKSWLEFVGRSMQQEIGNGWTENLHPDDRDRCLQIYHAAYDAREPFSIEYRLRRHDGEYRWVLDNQAPHNADEAFMGYIGTCVDITDRKQTEESLRQSEQRYRVIVEGSAEMLCCFRPDGTILFVNDAYAQSRGTTTEALLRGNFWEFITPGDRTAVQAILDRLTPEKPEIYIENQLETKDGVRWTRWTNRALKFDDSGHWLEAQSAGIDITDRKQAEEALQESEQRLSMLVANLPGIAYRCLNNPDRTMEFVSSRVTEITGYSIEDLSSNRIPWTQIEHPDDVDLVGQEIQQGIKERRPYQVEYRIIHKDGSVRWVREKGEPVFNGAESPVALEGFISDITEDQRYEQLLEGQLRQLRTIFQLNAAVAHSAEVPEIIDAALDGILDAVGAHRVSLLLFDDEGIIRFRGWRGLSKAYRKAVEGYTPWTPDDADAVPITISDISKDEELGELRETIANEGIRALAFIPLVSHARVLGKFMVYYNEPHQFPEDELQVCETIAGQISHAIEQTRARRALRESEQRFRLMADAAPVLIWVSDSSKEGVYFNKRWLKFTGRPLEKELGNGWLENIHPDDQDSVNTRCHAAFERCEPFRIEFRMRRADGQYRWILDHGVPRFTEQGKLAGYIGSCIDVTERRQAEEALRDSKEQYRRLVDLLPVALYTCEAPAGVITFYNEHAAALWGRSPEPGDTDERFCGAFKLWRADGTPLPHNQTPMAIAIREGRSFRNEHVIIEWPDSTRIHVLVNIDPIRDAEGHILGAINSFHDITAEKRAQKVQAQLAAIVEASDDAIISKSLDEIIQSWNAGAQRIFGYTAAEAVGQSIEMLIPPELRHEERTILQRLRQGQRVEPFETVRVSKDGRRISVSLSISPIRDESGQVVGASKVAHDITYRKQAEAALRVKQAELDLVAKTTPLILTRCSRDLRYLFANRAAAALFGCTPEDMVGRPLVEIMGEDVVEGIKPHIEKVLSGETVKFESEIAYRAAGRRWVHANYIPDYDEAGNVIGWVASIVDITEAKQAEEALREANHRKDEFLAMLAHELRNPLATIATSAIILRKKPGPDRTQSSVEMIERQVTHLRRLVDDLLDVTRLTRGNVKLKKKRLDFAEQMQTAASAINPLIKQKHHKLSVILPTQPVFVNADPIRLQQILVNLLSNAAQYTGRGGDIRLTASEEAGYIICRCRDNGRGIAQDKLRYIFEPFMQIEPESHRQQAGLGIGLAMVKQLVKLHGGSVAVQSEGLGHGSEFTIRLPVTSPARKSAKAAGRAVRKTPGKKRGILIVEDNQAFAEALKALLEDEGHRVWIVDNGIDALPNARQRKPDIALIDIGLPGQDGYTVAQELREDSELQKTTLIGMSGYAQDTARSKALFDSYFVKSNDPEILLDLLQKDTW